MIQYGLNPLGVNKTTEISDLDILKQIRDANPTSQLPALWLDSEDPYTQWDGVEGSSESGRVFRLYLTSKNISNIDLIGKLNSPYELYLGDNQYVNIHIKGNVLNISTLNLFDISYCTQLETINIENMPNLVNFNCGDCGNIQSLIINNTPNLSTMFAFRSKLSTLHIGNIESLTQLLISYNKLTSLPFLTSKGLITVYDFTYNNLPTSELDRLRSLGFTDESKLLPQNP